MKALKILALIQNGRAVHVSLRAFRHMLDKDRLEEDDERAQRACTHCGANRTKKGNGKTYDGGGGRKLCDPCATIEARLDGHPKRLVKKKDRR